MNVKIIIDYVKICEITETVPTFKGLEQFQKATKHNKKYKLA
jgi:hypothetical protein